MKVDVVKSIKHRWFGNGYKSLDKSLFIEIFCRLIAYDNLLFNFYRFFTF